MHRLILGITNSGKSNLAKRLAHDAAGRQQNVIVYDPRKSVGWPTTAKKFATPDAFFACLATEKSAHVFIDEAKTLWDADKQKADNILAQKRHDGMLVYVIAQRANMVPPNARNMCSVVYSFRQNGTNSAILSEEYHPAFDGVKTLAPNEFIFSDGFRAGVFRLDYSGSSPEGVPGPPPAFAESARD